jgi:hypothetical protein
VAISRAPFRSGIGLLNKNNHQHFWNRAITTSKLIDSENEPKALMRFPPHRTPLKKIRTFGGV